MWEGTMITWRVAVESRVRGYILVDAESAEAARTLVEGGDYDDIFGEDACGGLEIIYVDRD